MESRLCLLKTKTIKASVTSVSNLRAHIKHLVGQGHPFKLKGPPLPDWSTRNTEQTIKSGSERHMADEELDSDHELAVPTENEIKEVSGDELGFVSGWDDDTDGVEEELNPHASANKEILWAAENGENETIIKLIKENSSIVHVRDKDGYTPLHRACYNNHVDTIELLLQNGANIAAKTEFGWQPLHSACKWNNTDCAAKLLAYGADVNALTEGSVTPLHLAAGNSYAKECLELLLMHHNIQPDIKNQSNETAFDIARRSGRHAGLFEITEPCFQL